MRALTISKEHRAMGQEMKERFAISEVRGSEANDEATGDVYFVSQQLGTVNGSCLLHDCPFRSRCGAVVSTSAPVKEDTVRSVSDPCKGAGSLMVKLAPLTYERKSSPA